MFSEKPVILLACGIQFGKTWVGAWKMKMWTHTFTSPKDNFIITAPTYKVMSQATLPGFLDVMRGYGHYNKSEGMFQVFGGGKVWMRTATDADSIVGITNVRGIWGDEAGKYPLYFWENMQARASFKKAQIILTTSPYSVNWVYKELIRPHKKGKRLDVELVQARSNENPYFPKDEYERKRKTMDPRRFNMVYGGQFDRMEGLVYDVFRDDHHVIKPRSEVLRTGTIYIAGVDWGYTNPFAMVIIACAPNGHYYVVDEHYQTQLTARDKVDIARRKAKLWNIDRFYCDPSSPADIEEFHRAKLVAVPADNDIRKGVDRVYELLREDRLHFFEGKCRHLIDEMENYHYPDGDDLGVNQAERERNPVAQNDHALDALRYVVVSLFHIGARKRRPKVKETSSVRVVDIDAPSVEIEKLKKLPRNPSYEEW